MDSFLANICEINPEIDHESPFNTAAMVEIENFVKMLSALSHGMPIWHGYQNAHQAFFRHHLKNTIYNFDMGCLDLVNLGNQMALSLQDKQYQSLIHSFVTTTQIKPVMASILKLESTYLSMPYYFVLFSTEAKKIDALIWSTLTNYLQQQEQYLNLKQEQIMTKQRLLELEESNIGRSKYFAMIAHDLRAPFHGIMGCADILLHESEQLDSDAKYRLMDYIHDTSHSTYTLLEGLLNWSVAESGRFHANKTHFRVHDIVQMVLDLLCASAYKKQIKLQCDIEPDLFVHADVHMVMSIIQNLTSNALKFTPSEAQKKVEIIAQEKNHFVELIVQDNGIGMLPNQLEKLFQEHTLPSTQGTLGEKGMGLGLVLCKRFLDMNNGTISVESLPDEGTKFIVNLPLGNKNA